MRADKLKKIIISLILSILCVSSFADSINDFGYVPSKKVGKNRIYVAGRITVKTDMNMTDFAERRGVKESSLGNPDVFLLDSVDDDDPETHIYKNGDFFVLDYDLSELKSLYDKKNKEVYFCSKDSTLPFFFFQSGRMRINLPNNLCFTVNDEDRYYYLGDIEYIYQGRYFDLKDVKIIDNYDEAEKIISEMYPNKDINLARAELRIYKEEK